MNKRKILNCSEYSGRCLTTSANDGKDCLSGSIGLTIGYSDRFNATVRGSTMLTPSEARILARRLVELADEIEGSFLLTGVNPEE